MSLPPRGKFIVIDGMDGSGKGTQFALLRGALSSQSVHYTREPGGYGSKTAELLREVILEPQKFGSIAPVPLCDLFLFWASRAQHIEEIVEPKRLAGFHIVSDRYDSSTFAFQLYGEQKDFRDLFLSIRESVPRYFLPDAYIILDLPAEVAYARRKEELEQNKTRFDLKPVEYHERVRSGFQSFHTFADYSKVYMVDANRAREDVQRDLAKLVLDILST